MALAFLIVAVLLFIFVAIYAAVKEASIVRFLLAAGLAFAFGAQIIGRL